MFIKATVLVLTSVLGASNGWIVNCQYSDQDYGFSGFFNAYSCHADLTDDGSPDITSVTGTLDAGKTLADVLSFNLNSNDGVRTYKFPSNFGTTFPSLRAIFWGETKLESIKASDLQPFPNLVLLSLTGNFIRHIDGELFKYNPALQLIDLSFNYIDYIGTGIFSGLTQLQNAMFYNNICIGYSQMLQPIGPDYSVADFEADLVHLCGPVDDFEESSDDACSANCTALFDAIEDEVSIFETRLTAPWYEKLKSFFRTAFGQ